MMQDNHIGYTRWSIPEKNVNPTTLRFDTSHIATGSKPTDEYSIPAYSYSKMTEGTGAKWMFLPDLGRGKGCMGSSNVTAQNSGAALLYDVQLNSRAQIAIGILPTQDIYPERGLRIGVQIDDLPVQTIDARQGLHDEFGEYTSANLSRSKVLKPLPRRNTLALSGHWNGRMLPRRDEVFDNIRWLSVSFDGIAAGRHTLRLVMIDPEVVVEQIVINPDNQHYSYFGNR